MIGLHPHFNSLSSMEALFNQNEMIWTSEFDSKLISPAKIADDFFRRNEGNQRTITPAYLWTF